MKKLLILGLLTIAGSAFANERKECAYSCIVQDKTTQTELAGPSDFRAVGGYTPEQNTSCVTDLNIDNDMIKVLTSDSFQKEFGIAVYKNNNAVASLQAPYREGEFALSNLSLAVRCFLK